MNIDPLKLLLSLAPEQRAIVAKQLGCGEGELRSIEAAAKYMELNPPPVIKLPTK